MSGSDSSAPGAATDAPLAFTVHSLPSPALAGDEAARRTASGRWKMLALLAVCAAPVVASYFTYFVIRPQASTTNYGELVTPPRDIPADLALATLAGDAVAPASLQGQWLLVVVGDAACDARCESQLYLQRQLRETMGADKARLDKVWLVTDGGTPRPEVTQAIAQGGAATVLRVPPEALARWLRPADGRSLADHLYIVDPMGRWMMREPASPDPSRVRRDLARLLRASASWDTPGR